MHHLKKKYFQNGRMSFSFIKIQITYRSLIFQLEINLVQSCLLDHITL